MSKTETNRVYDPDFERRMKIACDNVPDIPPGRGRARWIVRELELRGVNVSLMTVVRWLQGLLRPRHKRMVVLAEVLRCDLAWLESGEVPELDKAKFDATADAAVNIAMGFIQWAGWHCALPNNNEPFIHFHSIIKGKQHKFHVCAGVKDDNGNYVFRVPPSNVDCVVLGLVEKFPTSFEMLRILPEVIDTFGGGMTSPVRIELTRQGNSWAGKTHPIPVVTGFNKSFVD